MTAQLKPKVVAFEARSGDEHLPVAVTPASAASQFYYQNNTVKTFHLELFRRSVLEQQIFSEIVKHLGPVENKVCLDLGSRNGVISHFLRQRGGDWYSADIGKVEVGSIRSLVRKQVFQTDGVTMPFADACFDSIVIVDLLGRTEDPEQFILELARVLKPSGRLVLNVQNSTALSAAGFRVKSGTEESRRFSRAELEQLLNKHFALEQTRTYSKIFTSLGAAFSQVHSTDDDIYRLCSAAKMSSAVYPLRSFIALGDLLCPFLPGEFRIISATRK